MDQFQSIDQVQVTVTQKSKGNIESPSIRCMCAPCSGVQSRITYVLLIELKWPESAREKSRPLIVIAVLFDGLLRVETLTGSSAAGQDEMSLHTNAHKRPTRKRSQLGSD